LHDHVITGIPPVTPGIKITQMQFGKLADFNLRHSIGNFAGDKLLTPPGRFMVKQDPRRRVDAERFAVIDGHPVAVDFGRAIW